ncbi:Crp/Fnr family transcriptional regulator [Oryzicola mucosus]|uniref:Crp/Fnr family transcriptional regulator n=1 Tax=Oryzicola mucosus TaxID=2767425 RepID=UPI001AEDC5A5
MTLGERETKALEALQGPRTLIAAGKEIVYEGQQQHAAYVVADGWACSYKELQDGARQVIDIQIPGDFLGLRSFLLRRSDQSFTTLTDVVVTKIATDRLVDTFHAVPRLAVALLWAASRDEAMVVEHLVSVGRRDAVARTVHFLLELGAKLKLVGHGSATEFPCPLSQSVLADALGITSIHLNRVLRQLRESELLIFRDGWVTFLDRERLAALTGFDYSYLDLETTALR